MTAADLSIGILGASGYTGAELLRLLAGHPRAHIAFLTAERHAGRPIASVFPHLAVLELPDLVRIEEAALADVDVIYCCLPHATTQEVIAALPRGPKVIDLSADFRLRDPAVYAEWYGHEHRAIEVQREAVYGLSEFARVAIRNTWLVANPGCYTTAAQLPLRPLLEAGLIAHEPIIIDAKSGITGAGRALKEGSLFAEAAEGFAAYGVTSHRHVVEIEQGLADSTGTPMRVSFTPHLVPMNRGILATLYMQCADGAAPEDLHESLATRFADEPFVHVLPYRALPATRHVRGSNHTLIAVHPDRRPGHAIVLAVLDNLVKGASGQALQNMNIMLELDETLGLGQPPMFP